MLRSAYLIFGDDEYLVTLKAKGVVRKLAEGHDTELGLEVIDGRVDTVAEAQEALRRCLEAVRTPGLFQRDRVVWLRDASFLADNPVGRSREVKAQVDRLAAVLREGLMPGLVLVVSACNVDKRFSFYRTIREVGEVVEIVVPKRDSELRRRADEILRQQCVEMGLQMDEAARNAFLERVGSDTRQIVSEVEKLVAYIGKKGRATTEDVKAVTSISPAVEVWDLADAFGNRTLSQALEIVRQLLYGKESPIRLIMSLETRVRDLLIYREALDCAWLVPTGGRYGQLPVMAWKQVPEHVARAFEEELERNPLGMHSYRVSSLAAQAQNFSRERLLECGAILIKAHEQLVTTGLPPRLVLESALVRMLS